MRILLAAAVLLGPAIASADPQAAQPSKITDVQQMKTDDCARARKANKTCVLDMGKEDIEGGVSRGDGEKVDILQFSKASSLIHIRRDFIIEILKTAEDID
jgi:hypothetical protein